MSSHEKAPEGLDLGDQPTTGNLRHGEHDAIPVDLWTLKSSVPDGQGELFPDYRHHGVFTDSPLTMLQAEKTHRAHAIVDYLDVRVMSMFR